MHAHRDLRSKFYMPQLEPMLHSKMWHKCLTRTGIIQYLQISLAWFQVGWPLFWPLTDTAKDWLLLIIPHYFFFCTALYRLEKFRETGSRPRIFRFIQLRHASRSQRPLLGKTPVLWKCLLLVTDPQSSHHRLERAAHKELRDQSWITRRLKNGDETWVLEPNNSDTVWLVSHADPWSPDLLAMSEKLQPGKEAIYWITGLLFPLTIYLGKVELCYVLIQEA